MSATAVRLGIALETQCVSESCNALSGPQLQQLAGGPYDLCSVLPVPLTVAEWRMEHRTARKRADRAFGRGYVSDRLERERWADHIYRINTSARERQGRPMSAGYLAPTEFSPLPDYPCARHAVRTTGVWHGADLVAYLVMIRAGELALVSQILGHADHLENEVMYLLFEHALRREIDADPGCLVVYNRHDSGTDGLRFFKERLGFEEMPVEWLP